MSSQAPPLPSDRLRLETRLHLGLVTQSHHHQWHTADVEKLQELETHIQAAARQLKPDAPQAAILAARRELAYNDLANHLVRRAKLPADPILAPEPLRIRAQHLDRTILDLAHDLEPADPREAIATATPIAHQHLSSQEELVRPNAPDQLNATQNRLAETSRQMKRLATFPHPTRQQRVHQILGDLRRLELLDVQYRDTSHARRELAFRGNVVELEAALERTPEPRALLEESLAEVYRDPGYAIKEMRDNTFGRGLQDTIERFDKDPAAFGKLRGVHVPLLGNTPKRTRAVDLAWHDSGYAANALARRDRIEDALEAAISDRRLQNQNRDLVHAFPSREKLLTELGRHMEGLEIHEVQPLLRPGQEGLVQDLRKSELTFLEPLRKANSRFRALDAGGARLANQAQEIAGLFQGAPQHILRRLTPPQMQAVLVATAIAKRAVKAVTRVARV